MSLKQQGVKIAQFYTKVCESKKLENLRIVLSLKHHLRRCLLQLNLAQVLHFDVELANHNRELIVLQACEACQNNILIFLTGLWGAPV